MERARLGFCVERNSPRAGNHLGHVTRNCMIYDLTMVRFTATIVGSYIKNQIKKSGGFRQIVSPIFQPCNSPILEFYGMDKPK